MFDPGTALAVPPAAASGIASPDWVTIGLVMAIVGSFLLANSILFRRPRLLVRERFGQETPKFRSIREYIFHRLQVNLGFGFLLAGFGLQLYGRHSPLPPEMQGTFPAMWIGLVVVLAATLLLVSWWWSLFAFRRYVRQYCHTHRPDFEADLALAREVGDLFGLTTHADDTVQSYLARVRQEVCDEPRAASRAAPPLELDEPELEEGLA